MYRTARASISFVAIAAASTSRPRASKTTARSSSSRPFFVPVASALAPASPSMMRIAFECVFGRFFLRFFPSSPRGSALDGALMYFLR